MKLLMSRIIMMLILLTLWLLLTYPLNMQELIVGSLVSLFIVIFACSGNNLMADVNLTPKSIIYFIAYCFFFFWVLIKSNINVALRVIDPKLPINPGIVKVRTNLKSRLGRLVLANSITLTPGTLTVETNGEIFYIHWIDVRGKNIEESTEQIVNDFEKYLGVIFG